MQWNNFACTSPPQAKTLAHDQALPGQLKSKSKSKNQHTVSSHKFRHHKEDSPFAKEMDNSISALFVKEMQEE